MEMIKQCCLHKDKSTQTDESSKESSSVSPSIKSSLKLKMAAEFIKGSTIDELSLIHESINSRLPKCLNRNGMHDSYAVPKMPNYIYPILQQQPIQYYDIYGNYMVG
jgi:L-cysteine desulfidase